MNTVIAAITTVTDTESDMAIDKLIEAGDAFIEATLALKAAKTKLAVCAEQYASAYEAFYHKPFVQGVSI